MFGKSALSKPEKLTVDRHLHSNFWEMSWVGGIVRARGNVRIRIDTSNCQEKLTVSSSFLQSSHAWKTIFGLQLVTTQSAQFASVITRTMTRKTVFTITIRDGNRTELELNLYMY